MLIVGIRLYTILILCLRQQLESSLRKCRNYRVLQCPTSQITVKSVIHPHPPTKIWGFFVVFVIPKFVKMVVLGC